MKESTNLFSDLLIRLGLQDSTRSIIDIYILFAISIPVSVLTYLIFEKYRHRILVDLGAHKWIIRK